MSGVIANIESPDTVLYACCLVKGMKPPSPLPLQLPFPLQLQLPAPLQLHEAAVLLRNKTSTSNTIHEIFLHPLTADFIRSRILVSLLDTWYISKFSDKKVKTQLVHPWSSIL